MGTQTTIYVGPWGGSGGSPFDDGSYSGIKQIDLTHGECIDSIQIQYDRNGTLTQSAQHGGQGGILSKVILDFPREYLTGISGHIGSYSTMPRNCDPVIRSLKFKTNRTTYGPFGEAEGTPFSLPMNGGKIVGFAGRCGTYLDSIGFHIRQT